MDSDAPIEELPEDTTEEPDTVVAAVPRRRRWKRPATWLALAVAGVAAGAAVVLTVLMLNEHRGESARRDHDGRIVEGARASVTALLSIDHTRARSDVQRVLELTTGAFREDFQKSAEDFVKTAEEKDVVSKGTVKAAALESSEPDGGVVIMAVKSEVTNSNGAKEDPRPFRMSVTMARDGDQFKMSSLEFVP